MGRALFGRQSFTGRGALSNPPGRFDLQHLERVDDGWYVEESPESIATTLTPEHAREIISTNDSPDIPFEQSINPYRGCSHGCIYCYARPSHAYMGLSPGLDFETRLFYKVDAAAILEKQLARPGYVCKPITLGANTDPYQPSERHMKVTRSILEVLLRTRHPVTIITKGALVMRDLDLLAQLAALRLVTVGVSVTSLDPQLKRTLEPRTAAPVARLRALRELSAAGVPCGALVAPVIPAINDHEIESILEACAQAGIGWAGYVLLRLPYEIKDLFREWLEANVPDRASRVMSLVRQMRHGQDYDPEWGKRMKGEGPIADLLARRFEVAKKRLGFGAPFPPLDITQFRVPPKAGDQMDLFG
jgi:DNA repair photolyase